jgi:hypothetical protein
MNLGHWQFLTGFFRFSFVKLFISWFALVPVAIAFLRRVPEIIYISPSSQQIIQLQTKLPFNWIILWVASLFFSAAAVLFLVFCPTFIRRHDTFLKYKTLGHSPRWVVWEIHYHLQPWFFGKRYAISEPLRKRLIDKKLALPSKDGAKFLKDGQYSTVVPHADETTLYFREGDTIYEVYSKQAPALTDTRENDLFWELFGFLTKRWPKIRETIKWLIWLSLLLVAFVVAENIWFAVRYILENGL